VAGESFVPTERSELACRQIHHKFKQKKRSIFLRSGDQMNKTLRTALVLALFVCAGLLLIVPARAQSVYGSIFGTVTDMTGAAIAGATITVTD
jgi:hypothetical protein